MDDTSDVIALAKCSSTHASRSARRVPFCSVLFLKFSAVTLQVRDRCEVGGHGATAGEP